MRAQPALIIVSGVSFGMTPTTSGVKAINSMTSAQTARETVMLSRVAALLDPAMPLDEVLRQVLRSLVEGLGVDRAELYMLDERARVLVGTQAMLYHAAEGRSQPIGIAGTEIPITDSPEVISATVRAGQTHVIEDLGAKEGPMRLSAAVQQRLTAGSFAAVPLIAWGHVVGVIALNDTRGRQPLRERLTLLDAFAVQAGLAIEHARLYQDRDRAIRELATLQRATAALQGSLPLEEVLQRILDGVTEGLGADRAILYLYDAERNMLRGAQAALRSQASQDDGGHAADDRQAALSMLRARVARIEIPVSDPDEVMSATVLYRRPFVVDGSTVDDNRVRISPALVDSLRVETFMTAPLLAQQGVVGVITVDNHRRGVPFEAGVHLLMSYGSQAGVAIERTLLEEQLRASERRHREFIERSPDGMVETSLEGRILSFNDRMPRLLGYTREELMSMNARDVYADQSQRDELVRTCLERGQVEGMEIAVRRKDGSLAHVNLSCRLRQESAEPVMESIIRDVTERWEVERQMRMLVDAVTHSADAIVSLDPEAHITSWNMGAEKIFGYTAAEMVGRPYRTLVPEDLMEELCEGIRDRIEKEGHLQGFETVRLHKDGHGIPVSVTASRMRQEGGEDLGWSIVLRDITERRREERHRRLLSSITEQSPDAILSVDQDGRITSWNRGAARMFGYAASEIVGRSWLELAAADRRAEFGDVVARDPAGEQPAIDTVARARDGRLLPVRLSGSVLSDEQGAAMGWSILLEDLTEQRSLAERSERLQEELWSRNRLEGIVGNSRAMEEVRERIRRVARFSSSVLLVGSSGTGKENVASAIHYNSPRRANPLIKVNCAAIPEHLLESELFGIERNVATGVDGRLGKFEMANGGTLFLDEIGDMSLATQAKILRALQEREFERVGGKKLIGVDVRIIAATNKDLAEEIKARRFRDDLYYRLNVIVITLPPLVERREDIDPLIDHFLEMFTRENGLPRKRLTLQARMLLNEYDWPGNVRELEHCIERAVVMGEGPAIVESDLPPSILIWKEMGGARPGADGSARGGLSEIMHQVERRTVLEALQRSGGVQARAARLLGISERSMWYRVKKLGLKTASH